MPPRQRSMSTETSAEGALSLRFFTLSDNCIPSFLLRSCWTFPSWTETSRYCIQSRASHLARSKLWQQSPAPAASLSILTPYQSYVIKRERPKKDKNCHRKGAKLIKREVPKNNQKWPQKMSKTCSAKYDEPDAGVDDWGGHGASDKLPHCPSS